MKKDSIKEYLEIIYSGSPCSHDDCSKTSKKPCPYCGRIAQRGIVEIRNRTGPVHLERLNSTNKKEHILKSIEDQETSIIKLWIGPSIGF